MKGIEFIGVRKRFANGYTALSDVSVTFPEGSLTFITGASGAGKTTLLRLVLRELAPSGGRVLVNGVDLASLSRAGLRRYRQGIGSVVQEQNLLGHRTVFENVALPLWVAGLDNITIGKRVSMALARVGLGGQEGMNPDWLSGGEKKRVLIARALVAVPNLIVADEPTGNLDLETAWGVMQLFEAIQQDGATVLIASHDLDLIQQFNGHAVRLRSGRVIEREKRH